MTVPQSLSVQELQERLVRGDDLLVIDVREDSELALARLPHPVLHLPLSRATDWIDSLANQAPPQQPLAVLCHGGIRSWQFGCWLLEQRGYTSVWNVEGGIDAWSRFVDPEVPRY
ncbi:MAG: rhodanese-like domain-containing protein [Cyanobium sp.]|jgi:rhodanese-related sulfurtransferase|nr:rhodanese-like domain-containing protein [Synechococcaceae cyanobacterium]